MLRSRYIPILLLCSLPAALLFAQGRGGGVRNPQVVQVHRQNEPAPHTPLKLEFIVDVGDQHKLAVVCAAGEFQIDTVMGNDDGERQIQIKGTVRSVGDGKHLLLSFEALIQASDLKNGSDTSFKSMGSVPLKLDEDITLAVFPGPTLKVKATEVE